MARSAVRAARGDRPVRLELTAAGKVSVLILVIAFCMALPQGNNPVLFAVSCLAGTLLVSLLLTRLAAGRLRVERFLPARVFTGEPFRVRVRVENTSDWRPALGLGFKDAFQIARPGEVSCGPTLPVLPPGGRAELAYTKRLHRRGVYAIESTLAATSFPFALFERRELLRSRAVEITVLPALGRLGPMGLRDWAERISVPQALRRHREGEEEFHCLREYRPGDNPRLVHWKTSARARKLMRRVLERESVDDLHVLLDTRVAGLDAESRRRNLEKAVSCAATLLVEAGRRGRRAMVHFPGGSAGHGGSLQGILPVLDVLAGVEAGETRAAGLVEQAALPRRARGLLLSLGGTAAGAQRAAAARGLELTVWDVGHRDFGRYFRRR
jgi:uncharacterized protein (DUF58 family)